MERRAQNSADSAREGGVDLSTCKGGNNSSIRDSAREGGVDLSFSSIAEKKLVSRLRPRGRGGFKPGLR